MMLPQWAHGADTHSCSEIKLSEKDKDTARIYALDATTSFVTDYDNSLDKPNDFGRRLMLFKKEGGADKRVYYSKGSWDSYILRPTFFANCGGYYLLILAETGTEYSWGMRVFAYKLGQVKDLGDIPIAMDVEDERFNDSAIPHMRFREEGSSLVISFDNKVVRDPGGLHEKHYTAAEIEYRIGNDKLVERIRGDIQK